MHPVHAAASLLACPEMTALLDCRADLISGHGAYPDPFPRPGPQFSGPPAASAASAADYSSAVSSSTAPYSSGPSMVADYHHGASGANTPHHGVATHPGGPQPFMPSPPALYGAPSLHMRPNQPYSARQDQVFCSHFPSPQSLDASSSFPGPHYPPSGHEDRWRSHRGFGEAPTPNPGSIGFAPPRQQLNFAPFVLGGVPPGQSDNFVTQAVEETAQSDGSIQDSPVAPLRRHGTKEGQHPDLQTFDNVPGRLCLLSSSSKYKVTVGEIKRRISPPECLNASLLGGVLRRAKSKNGGSNLRNKLEKIGLSLPAGRRKGTTVTGMTALVEEEALKLASDYKAVCDQSFPSKAVGEGLVKALLSEKKDAQAVANMLHSTNLVFRILCDLLRRDRSPGVPRRANAGPTLEPGLQRHLTNFNLLTHNFGGPAALATADTLRAVLLASEESLGSATVTSGPEGKKSGKTEKKLEEKE